MTLEPIECSCKKCQNMCQRPCWGTPSDIQKLIDEGYGGALMLDWWGGDDKLEHTYIICPANREREKKAASFWPVGWCTFFQDGLCFLHDQGLKPTEGKLAYHKDRPGFDDVHLNIAKTWNTPEGRELVAKWRRDYME